MNEQMVGLILRHGEAAANEQGIFRSWGDYPLTEAGIEQAKEAANYLKKYPICHILTSPLLRAFVTADYSAVPHRLPVYQHRGLFPWRLGIFSGLDRDENQEALHLFVENPNVRIPSGESLRDFEDRQFAFWQAALAMARKNGLTLYVCHNSVVTALLNFMEGGRKADSVTGSNIEPGGVAEIYFDGRQHRVEPVFGKSEPAVFGGS
jgi:broad specificity phosphatase PhoE